MSLSAIKLRLCHGYLVAEWKRPTFDTPSLFIASLSKDLIALPSYPGTRYQLSSPACRSYLFIYQKVWSRAALNGVGQRWIIGERERETNYDPYSRQLFSRSTSPWANPSLPILSSGKKATPQPPLTSNSLIGLQHPPSSQSRCFPGSRQCSGDHGPTSTPIKLPAPSPLSSPLTIIASS